MIWADRIAIVWAGIVAFIFFLACRSPDGTDPDFLVYLPYILGWLALPPWLLLRGISWIFSPRQHGT